MGDPLGSSAAVRARIWSIDDAQPVSALRRYDELIDDRHAQRRLATGLMALFAGVGLLLAVAGLFAEGHLLFEDVPGVAKTMLSRAIAQSIGCTPSSLARPGVAPIRKEPGIGSRERANWDSPVAGSRRATAPPRNCGHRAI